MKNEDLNRGILRFGLAAFTFLLPLFAASQEPATSGALQAKPPMAALGAPAGPLSPEVHGDNRVTFRLSPPRAAEVVLNGDWATGRNIRMTKDEQGIWSVTLGPMDPEFWGYSFSVDGVRMLDPQNPNTKRDGVRYASILLISGPESALYSHHDVPHGTVSLVWYDSPTLSMKRRMYVYTPPGYETSRQRYPVLYLLHGGGGDEDAWITLGRANWILDNLIAREKAREMIVVMPNGNATQKMAIGSGPVSGQELPMQSGARGAPSPVVGLFPESLVKDIIPFVERRYRVIADKKSRAIAGLSMGGGHAMTATARYPGAFHYIGVWSAGSRQPDEELLNQLMAIKGTGARLYYVGCGVEDQLAHAGSTRLVSLLRKLDMRYKFRESTGGHTWFNWRLYLSDFVPLLFR